MPVLDRVRRLASRIVRAITRRNEVPARVQSGPTCGLDALGMVMDYYHERDPSALVPRVWPDEDQGSIRHALNYAPNTDRTLLGAAQALGFTPAGPSAGIMFVAEQLGRLADQFGYGHRLYPHASIADLAACLERGHPPLICFDVNRSGDPGRHRGLHAHWCVVEAIGFTAAGEEIVRAKHGWDGESREWPIATFMRSVMQLNRTAYFGPPLRDIRATLRDQAVEIIPPWELPAPLRAVRGGTAVQPTRE